MNGNLQEQLKGQHGKSGVQSRRSAKKNSLGWENGVPASAVLREISEAEDVSVAHSYVSSKFH